MAKSKDKETYIAHLIKEWWSDSSPPIVAKIPIKGPNTPFSLVYNNETYIEEEEDFDKNDKGEIIVKYDILQEFEGPPDEYDLIIRNEYIDFFYKNAKNSIKKRLEQIAIIAKHDFVSKEDVMQMFEDLEFEK